jgi:hypothetical protein
VGDFVAENGGEARVVASYWEDTCENKDLSTGENKGVDIPCIILALFHTKVSLRMNQ